MQAARRLYLYAMSGITLGVVAYGLVILFRVLLDPIFPGRDLGYEEYLPDARQQLSQAIAMLGVGFPVWAVHWWLIQRGLRFGRPGRDEERGSDLRAIYLTGVLLITLIIWANGGISLLHWIGTRLFDATPEYFYLDPLGSTTLGAVALIVWLYHGLVRRRDLAAGPVSGPAAFIPRLYLYGVALGALFAAAQAFDAAVGSIISSPPIFEDEGEDAYARYFLIEHAMAAVGWALVWLGHWWYANRVNRDPGWRGTDERQSRTRVAAFVAAIVAGVLGALVSLSSAASAALMLVFPDPNAFGTDGLAPVIVPLIQAVPWTIIWFAHARALSREPAAVDHRRALHQARLVSHGAAAVALGIGATGTGWLIGFGIDVALGGQRSAGSGGSAHELATWLPLAALGLGTWLWFWRAVVARRRLDPVGEADSTIRRAFLFVTLGFALVVAIAAAAAILYRFVGTALGAETGGNVVSELSTPLGALIAAGVVLAYHGLLLRGDQRLAASAKAGPAVDIQAPGSEAGDLAAPAEAAGPARQRRTLALTGPAGADLDAALASARAVLPPGIEIVDAEG